MSGNLHFKNKHWKFGGNTFIKDMFKNSRKNKILQNIFGKQSVNVYFENYKTYCNKSEKTQDGKVHRPEGSAVKMAVSPKPIYRFSAFSVQVPTDFLAESDKVILNSSKASVAIAR